MRILVVDDSSVNRAVLSAMIEACGGSSDQAEDGPEALRALDQGSYDLVLLDIHMPGMDGFDVVDALRSGQSPSRSAHVVAVTADTMAPRQDYLKAGFDDYLNKPVPLNVVRRLVSAPLKTPLQELRLEATG